MLRKIACTILKREVSKWIFDHLVMINCDKIQLQIIKITFYPKIAYLVPQVYHNYTSAVILYNDNVAKTTLSDPLLSISETLSTSCCGTLEGSREKGSLKILLC